MNHVQTELNQPERRVCRVLRFHTSWILLTPDRC